MMLAINKNSKSLVFGLVIIIFILSTINQSNAQNGSGGTKSLFLGLGARSLSLGNAFVALSDDPTAVFFNPAGLDFIEKKTASFYYTNLLEGAQYNFVGLVYPTTSIGSFGFGWIRIGTGDIEARDNFANPEGTFDHSQNQFIFSYAKQIMKSVSVGLNIKLERMGFSWENTSDSGVGLDLGVLYRPDFDNVLLRDLSFGLNIQNLVNPQIRLIDASEASPLNFKLGLAKPIQIGEKRNSFNLLFDFNKSEGAPSMYHAGAEYSFNKVAMLRVGINNGLFAFGAGAVYNNIHVDYSYGKMFAGPDDYSGSHRFSITIEFGKGKTELIRIARERQQRELNLRVDNQVWFNRESEFNTNMEEGREKYYDKDYLGAYVDFSSAFEAANALVETALRLRGKDMSDPEANIRVETANSSIQEAQTMLDLANARYDSTLREEIRSITRETQQSTLEKELRDFVIAHREKGNAFYMNGSYSRALSEWQLALDRISQGSNGNIPEWAKDIKERLENNITNAEEKLQGNIKEAIRRADAFARRGQYPQALEELNKVRGGETTETERRELQQKFNSYQAQLTFQQNYDEGVRRYANKEWKSAMQAFDLALRIKPGDTKARKYYKDAEERSKAFSQVMPPNLLLKFMRGAELFRQGKYNEALKIWEQTNEEQPYNKDILDAIDRVKERLKEKR